MPFTIWVKFQAPGDGTFFLQPINADGSSIFKLGSTISVKFKLQGASAGITNLVAKPLVAKISNSVTAPSSRPHRRTPPIRATRSAMTRRQAYTFNLSTKGMTPAPGRCAPISATSSPTP